MYLNVELELAIMAIQNVLSYYLTTLVLTLGNYGYIINSPLLSGTKHSCYFYHTHTHIHTLG